MSFNLNMIVFARVLGTPKLAKFLALTLLFFLFHSHAQFQCPTLTSPINGDTQVPVNTDVSWNVVGGINGYSVSLGTTEGASDILNSRSAALVNSLMPKVGLPENTKIFVTISLFLEDGTFVTCPSESFTTEDVTTPPNCTRLNNPLANAESAGLGQSLVWDYSATATGYRIIIGTTEGGEELVSETDVGNVLTYDTSENFPENTEIFVRIIPYNENGDGQSCLEEKFTTGDSNIDCEMFRPKNTIPKTFGLCGENSVITITSDDIAEGVRWYKTNDDGTEVLISEEKLITITNIGQYRLEVYNNISILGDNMECGNSEYFSVVYSEVAIVESITVTDDTIGVRLELLINGAGDYEFALDREAGPYQDSNIFSSVTKGNHLIYIRDKNGCGVLQYQFDQTVSLDDFPNFFSPNGDGINEYWQFSPLSDTYSNLDFIFIYDRYGMLLSQVNPMSLGWDGTFNGKMMPSSTYWFKAISKGGGGVQGYFSLIR